MAGGLLPRVLALLKAVIGLTGGIGSGKSTVAALFAARGATVVDTDEIARALTTAQGEAMPALAEAFGPALLASDGALDRAAMRAIAFADPAARARLETILHPLIRAGAGRAIESARGDYVLLAVPLLFETRSQLPQVARTLVVDCPEELQVARTMARSGLDEAEVRRIMETQWPRWRRLQCADDVISNAGDIDSLAPQVEALDRRYRLLPG
jgi:dephospho-CoA kinase